jgi:hypothetical protein
MAARADGKSSTWWACEARRIAHGLGELYTDAELDAALEPLFARCMDRVRFDEAMACQRALIPDGNPVLALDDRIRMHRTRARRKRA